MIDRAYPYGPRAPIGTKKNADNTWYSPYVEHSEPHITKTNTPEVSIDFEEAKLASETQIGGNHYLGMAIEPIDFIYENAIPYHEANVIKYVCRHKNKNGLSDLKKAIHYIEMLIELEYEGVNDGC